MLCWLAAATAACAAESQEAGQPAQPRTLLPEAFLVFLGEWGDQQGRWQDPLEFDDPQWQVLDNDAERQNETD